MAGSSAGRGIVAIDHRVETLAGSSVLVDVLSGANSPEGEGSKRDGSTLGVCRFSGPAHGSLALLPAAGSLLPAPGGRQGVFRYVPQPGFTGVDYFHYGLGDLALVGSEQGSGVGSEQVSGWVQVRVLAVNQPPVAKADLVLVEDDGPVTFQILANDQDPDGDELRITDLTLPAKGQLALNADQSFTYLPGPGFTGQDSFTYAIRDIRAPGDSQVGGASAHVTLIRPAVAPPANTPPRTGRDQATTAENTAVAIAVLANDSDADGDPLRVVGLTVPLFGSVVLELDQTVTYTPAPSFTGIDDFTYIADDGRGGTDTGIVVVKVG